MNDGSDSYKRFWNHLARLYATFFLKSIACFANHYFDSSLSAREWVDIKSSERRRSGGEEKSLLMVLRRTNEFSRYSVAADILTSSLVIMKLSKLSV